MSNMDIIQRVRRRILPKLSQEILQEVEIEVVKMEEEEKLREEIKGCTSCALAEDCAGKVGGAGPMDTDIMFVGEAPAEVETHTGIPFTGPSGQILDKALEAIGIDRTQYYFTNVVKCKTPNNRTPTLTEMMSCYKHLKKELEIVQPKVIVCLGGTAASMLIHPEFKVTQEQGQWFELNKDTRAIAVFHPAYLLYLGEGSNKQNSAKWEVFNTLKKVKEYADGGFRNDVG